MPSVPFKLNQDRRHHIPRQKCKPTNWREYDASIRQRGKLTKGFTEDAVQTWQAQPRITRGGQPDYSPRGDPDSLDLAHRLPPAVPTTEGLIGSVIGLLGLDLAVPDHTTLCRRAETLEVPRPRPRSDGEPVHLLVDSTGPKAMWRGRVADREARHPHAPVLAEAAPRHGRQHRADRRSGADRQGCR